MQEVELDIRDGVALVTLAAPERMNAITSKMATQLMEAADSIDENRDVAVTVIRGGDRAFCAGAEVASLSESSRDPSEDATFRDMGVIYESFARIEGMKTPTIAAVRGYAIGAGLNLALATDVRVVARDARLRSGFLRIGVHPGGGHFTLLGRTAGRSAAAGMGIFGCDVDGDRAVTIGLAWEAVEDEEVEPRAIDLAHAVAGDPPLVREATRHLRMETGGPLGGQLVAAIDVERAAQMWSMRRRLED